MAEEPPLLKPDLLPSIDMSSLTQSELRSLSLLSNNSNDAMPFVFELNSSLFNESVSNHKQTFSDSPHKRRRRGFSLLRRERSESNLIVNFLKRYLQLGYSERKRKRKRNVREEERRENASVEIVNRNGEVVDLAALAKRERENEGGPFGAELRRRAAGMEREEELLAMLAVMDGKWCSRRKKRRVVQACLLGDALPVGWKLIIALRRKGGRFFPYCRRYISPTGEQLVSCKEVSSYLRSYFGIHDTSVLKDIRDIERHQEREDNSDKHLMSSHRRTTKKYRLGSSVGAGVIIRDGKFECQFCHKVFEERRRYLGHVGNHVRGSARRSEVSMNQVMGNTGFPCQDQLPTKTSISRMDALIEIAQSSIQDISPSLVSIVDDVDFAKNSTTLDADFEIEKSSSICLNENNIREGKSVPEELNPPEGPSETCSACPDEIEMEKNRIEDDASSEELNLQDRVREISTADRTMTCSSACPDELGMENDYEEGCKTLPEELNPHDKRSDRERNDQSFTFNTTILPMTENGLSAENTSGSVQWEYNAAENNGSTDESKGMLGIHYLLFNENPSAVDGAGEIINSNGVAEPESEPAQEYDAKELTTVSVESNDSSYAMPQTLLNASSPFDEILGKERRNMASLDQNLGSVIRPEYMKLDEVDTQMYDAMTGEEFVSLSAISMGFEINGEGELRLDASVGSQLEFPMDIAQESVTTTVCVWCGGEFSHQVIDIELQPDTVGFMCPTCRNKISKQFNHLESNFSLSHPYY